MKKLMVLAFAATLLLSVASIAQDTMSKDSMKHDSMSADSTAKPVNVMGKISDDGKSFTSDKDGKTWTIKNPEAVKGHEGHHVVLNAHVYADTSEVHVMSLKMAKEKGMKKDSSM